MQTSYKRDFTWPTYLTKKETIHAETPELEVAKEENQEKNPCEKERRRAATRLTFDQAAINTTEEANVPSQPEYLINLFKKYPHLHHFYQQAGEEQLMKKIEEQVYKTSYQIDYGKEGFVAQDDYDELIEIAEALRAKRTKVCNAEAHGDVGRRLANNCTSKPMEACTCEEENAVVKLAMKPPSITKEPRVPRDKKQVQTADQQSFKGAGKAPGKMKSTSEYKDTIEKLANIIIKHKLHNKKTEFATF